MVRRAGMSSYRKEVHQRCGQDNEMQSEIQQEKNQNLSFLEREIIRAKSLYILKELNLNTTIYKWVLIKAVD